LPFITGHLCRYSGSKNRVEYTQVALLTTTEHEFGFIHMPATQSSTNIPESLFERLGPTSRILVLSGAGMSAESGIPTFRDAQTGMWAKYRPEELATPQAFERNPARVWNWYESRRKDVRAARPHAGYEALVELEAMVADLTVATQNVDGLHQLSGSGKVFELHGNIMRSICHMTRRPIDEEWIAQSEDSPPHSPWDKGGLARPDVVWFGENLPMDTFDAASEAAIACDICLSVGTSALVHPAAAIPLLARSHGAVLVEVNPGETPLSPHADFRLAAGASDGLCALAEAMREVN
jgi:NAD-dependent deacetylase